MVLSCAAEYTSLPQRFAGTARQYSMKAMPQLTRITSGSQDCLNLRWPYQAKVMNTFEANSIRTGRTNGEIKFGMKLPLQGLFRPDFNSGGRPVDNPPRHQGVIRCL